MLFSLIANATSLHHRLNKMKHCLVICQQSIDSCVNIEQFSEFLFDCNPLHTFLSKLSDIIKIIFF